MTGKRIWLWTRDGETSVLQRGKRPPQAIGEVHEVSASSRPEAEALLRLSKQAEPDEEADPHGWADWRAACRRVRLVDLSTELEG